MQLSQKTWSPKKLDEPLDENEGKKTKPQQSIKKSLSTKKNKKTEQIKEDSITGFPSMKNIWKVREEYYKKAVRYWKITVTDYKTIPKLGDRKLRMPLIYKDKSGKFIGGEGPEEWADKVSILKSFTTTMFIIINDRKKLICRKSS